jgi:hypothetical protein
MFLPLLVLNLATLSLSSAVDAGSPTHEATYTLRTNAACGSKSGDWEKILPDTCVPVLDTGYHVLEVVSPWPVCENGTDAKMAFFRPSTLNCDPGYRNILPLKTKEDLMNACAYIKEIGSFSFWCNGAPVLPLKPPTREAAKGGVIKHLGKGCSKSFNKPKPELHDPDTCIDIDQGYGLEFSRGATCKNGTKAMAAGFKGKGCDPTSNPLKDPFTAWDERIIGFCLPTDEIQSMAFWCDGFDGVDMGKPREKSKGKSNLRLILGLTLGLGGGLLLVTGGLLVGYKINWRFRTWVQVSDTFVLFNKLPTYTYLYLGTFWRWGWIHCLINCYILVGFKFGWILRLLNLDTKNRSTMKKKLNCSGRILLEELHASKRSRQ